jgi:anaerobic magnesium-protoporphyrin IX monomethyl ester cyclase
MAQCKVKNGKSFLYPRWRTKSVERTLEEVELLYNKYKKKFLIFTDDTWNANQKWNKEFAEALIERDLDLGWFAFMRADFILRDERAGVFKKMVDSGLSHVCVGVERSFDSDLRILNKRCSSDMTKQCFNILKHKYPHIFRQATFIVGLRNETKKTMLEQLKYAKELDVDYPAFHPMTPVPGTELWKEAKRKGWIEVDDFRFYDWLTPVMSSEHLSRDEIENIIIHMNKDYMTPKRLIKGLLSPYKYKRNMYIWFLLVSLRLGWDVIKNYINPFKTREEKEQEKEPVLMKLVKPKWYND